MESPAGVGAMVVNGAEPPLASDQAGGDPIDVGVGRCLLEQVRQPAYPAPRRAHHHGSSALSQWLIRNARSHGSPTCDTHVAGGETVVGGRHFDPTLARGVALSRRPPGAGACLTSTASCLNACSPDLTVVPSHRLGSSGAPRACHCCLQLRRSRQAALVIGPPVTATA